MLSGWPTRRWRSVLQGVRAGGAARHSVGSYSGMGFSQPHSPVPWHRGVPELLGDFLNYLVKRRHRLRVRVLIWDYPVIFAKGRELSPIYGLGWRPRRHMSALRRSLPRGRLAAPEDRGDRWALAFCGGLDLTRSRWDSCEHRAHDERRINEGEKEVVCSISRHDDGDGWRGRAHTLRNSPAALGRATGRRMLPREGAHRFWNRRDRPPSAIPGRQSCRSA